MIYAVDFYGELANVLIGFGKGYLHFIPRIGDVFCLNISQIIQESPKYYNSKLSLYYEILDSEIVKVKVKEVSWRDSVKTGEDKPDKELIAFTQGAINCFCSFMEFYDD